MKEVALPHRTVNRPAFEDLDGALAYLALLHATLEEKRTVIAAGGCTLHSYLRLRVIQRLTNPQSSNSAIPDFVPPDLRKLADDEFLVSLPGSGEMDVYGVRVKEDRNPLRELVVGKQYLLFVSSYLAPNFGDLAFDLDGVFGVSASGSLDPLRPNRDVAAAFKAASLLSLRDVEMEMSRRRGRDGRKRWGK